MTDTRFKTFKEFYPFYLSEHSNKTCRVLHYIGSTNALIMLALFVATNNLWFVAVAFVSGYAFAWVGHIVFEKNTPATFSYPFYSFTADWVMYKDAIKSLFFRDKSV